MNKNDEHWQKRTLWYSYVLDDKMRTNYSWKAVEPILEMRKIGKSYHMVGVAHYVQFWNPDPLFTMDALNNEMTLSIERPTLYSHYLIVPRIGNNDGQNAQWAHFGKKKEAGYLWEGLNGENIFWLEPRPLIGCISSFSLNPVVQTRGLGSRIGRSAA